MKKFSILVATAIIMFFSSCGGSKQVVNNDYYNNPGNKQALTEERMETLNVDKLAAEETDRIRAVGIANDYEESDARIEALQNGQREIATLLETSIIAITQEYSQKSKIDLKKISESKRNDFVEYTVSQTISVRAVGTPERFKVSDGSIRIYRCVELREPTTDVLEKVYDSLTKEEIIGIDYDKEQFIKDNIERINELREKVK